VLVQVSIYDTLRPLQAPSTRLKLMMICIGRPLRGRLILCFPMWVSSLNYQLNVEQLNVTECLGALYNNHRLPDPHAVAFFAAIVWLLVYLKLRQLSSEIVRPLKDSW